MATRVNQSQFSRKEPKNASHEVFRHIRTNPVTGKTDYYFPLEITDPSIRVLAQEQGLEIGRTRLGFRVFDAVMVPCKKTSIVQGREVYIDTPSEVQRRRYLDLVKDELNWQEDVKQDGRCSIPDGHGGIKRCLCCIPNPEYVPGGDMPKTLPIRCEGCKYEPTRQAHTIFEMSALDHESDDGKTQPYETPAPENYYDADRYERMRKPFVAFVRERNPKLAPLAETLTLEFTKSEAARLLGDATSTVGSRSSKLKDLALEFLDNIITF